YEITLARDITESKQYEELLKKTFDLTLDNMPCYTAKWQFSDGDILLVDSNQDYLDFMDISAEEAFGKSIIYGFNEEEKQEVMAVAYACEKGRKPITFTSRAVKADGVECWIKVQASFFEEKDGHSIYYGTITDITDLVKTQNELSRTINDLEAVNAQLISVNAYRDLMNYSHAGGMMVRSLWNGDSHKILYVSPGLLNICGYKEEDFNDSIIDGRSGFIWPEDADRVAEVNAAHTTIGDSFTVSYRICNRSGDSVWVMEHAMVVAMPNGEAVVAAMVMDISKQKELEQNFRISQEEYKIAATLSNRAVLSFDVKHRSFVVISQGDNVLEFERAARDCPEQAIRDGIVAPESVDTIREIFAAIDRGEQRDKDVLALISHDGVKHWEEAVYSLIFDDNGNPLTAILAFDDVTAKKNAEALFNISSTFLNYSQNASKLLVIDLTTKTIGYETEGPHGILTNLAGTKDAHEAMRYTIQHMVVPEDQDACAEFFSEQHFMNAYQRGITEESFEYRGYTADNIAHWMNVQTRMVEDTYTKDIIVYVVFSDINEQKLAELELLRRAQTDSLTGLMNRESFEEEIRIRCSDPANRACGSYNAIIMIDVDKFKSINDTYGHDAGDEALREVAHRIKSCLRDDDLVARF
ncbi:MAG: PAS domain S-box protein, partial [Methanocorpusculum sp.]|nr:PAS domain S-box protein [Methanocorpusculum sp.]